MKYPRKIIHIDMDYFYAQIEEQKNSHLKNQPLAVGGQGIRGVIATCNYIARQFGLHSALSTRQALERCPHLVIVLARMAVYKEVSQVIHEIFHQYSDLVEPLSLDEAFLDASAHQSATKTARQIRSDIYQHLGLTASSGVAANKFLAKVASNINKPNGECVIRPEQVTAFMPNLPVNVLPGVGPVMAQKLADLKIVDCAELAKLSLLELNQYFGRFGQRLYQLVRGIDDRPVDVNHQRKSVTVETTFVSDLSLNQAGHALNDLVKRLKLRLATNTSTPMMIKALVLKLKSYDFQRVSCELQYHSIDIHLYRQLLYKAYARHNKTIRLLGVGVRFQQQGAIEQLALF
ncbi:DNA polymerase IV [Piscirickettsia salmonis]|uniref:DNA polymerase IV n=1 Tax=Piscirickettsia salmonis TaxID=1238 RepID=UPI001E4341FC|nr:DNA polymerase IV [Piscirickettsia salmonis]